MKFNWKKVEGTGLLICAFPENAQHPFVPAANYKHLSLSDIDPPQVVMKVYSPTRYISGYSPSITFFYQTIYGLPVETEEAAVAWCEEQVGIFALELLNVTQNLCQLALGGREINKAVSKPTTSSASSHAHQKSLFSFGQ